MPRSTRQTLNRTAYYMLVLPAALILLVVNTFPLLYSCCISLTNYSVSNPDTISFVGLSNFVHPFKDPMFLNSLEMTIKFTAGSVFAEFLLGLLVAVLLNRLTRHPNLLLGVFLLPTMITPIIVGLLWRFMLNDQTGFVNYFLAAIGIGRFPFLSNTNTAFLSIILADLWQWTPCHSFVIQRPSGAPKRSVRSSSNRWSIRIPEILAHHFPSHAQHNVDLCSHSGYGCLSRVR